MRHRLARRCLKNTLHVWNPPAYDVFWVAKLHPRTSRLTIAPWCRKRQSCSLIDFRSTCRCTISPRPTHGLYIPPTTTTTKTKMKRKQEVVSRRSSSSGGGILWPQLYRSYSCCYCIVLSLLLQYSGHFGADAGWIDLDTPFDKRTTQSLVDHSTYYLVSCFIMLSIGFLLLHRHLTYRRNDDTILSLDTMLIHIHTHTHIHTYRSCRMNLMSPTGLLPTAMIQCGRLLIGPMTTPAAPVVVVCNFTIPVAL
jgi:preprotein translocase subunit SecG